MYPPSPVLNTPTRTKNPGENTGCSKCSFKLPCFASTRAATRITEFAHSSGYFILYLLTHSVLFFICAVISKQFRQGRQEDAHEFLRYFVDGLQKICLQGQPSKLDLHSKTTTVVHKIFGGYHRSQGSCCGWEEGGVKGRW